MVLQQIPTNKNNKVKENVGESESQIKCRPITGGFHRSMLTMTVYWCFQNGETALHIAARHGQLKMVQALLKDGGDPMWQSKVTDDSGTLQYTVERYTKCISVLML